MKRFVQLQGVLQAYHDQDIPVIVLKGAALAELVYPSLGCRPMGDFDLLVRQSHLQKAEEILETLGFQSNEQHHSKQWYREFHHHVVPYESQDGSVIVELHHHIIPLSDPVQIPIDELWDRSIPTCIASVPCRILAPDDMVMHLCHHLSASNAFLGQLRGLCDIAQTIVHDEGSIDWRRLFNNAMRFGLQKHLYYSMWLAKTCVGADVPSDVIQKF